MKKLRLSAPKKLATQAAALLAFAGLSACNNANDPQLNEAAANQSVPALADDAASRSNDAMEGEGRMHNEMSGRTQTDGSMSASKGGMADDDAMGGSNMAPVNGKADASPPMKNDAMPANDSAPMMDDDKMMMKDDM